PEQQDEQAHYCRQHRPFDEDIGKPHQLTYSVVLFWGSIKATELSILTLVPGWILFWPTVTTCSPAFTPSLMRTRPSRTSPGFTNRRSTSSCCSLALGSACFAGTTTYMLSP